MGQQQMTFRAIEVGDGGDGRWAAHTQPLWMNDAGLAVSLTFGGRFVQGPAPGELETGGLTSRHQLFVTPSA